MEKINVSKIKNIILDLDNTIILDKKSDSESYKKALSNSGYDEKFFNKIYQLIDDYDKSITIENPYYNEEEMLEFINLKLKQNFSMKLIDEIKNITGKEWTKRIIISEKIMDYLFSKYNLYVYTNYYQDVQKERIKNIGYLKYFKKIFGANKYGCKQYKKCFENVLNEIGAKSEECIMIGDDKSRDIQAANNLGMQSILYDYNGKRDKKEIQLKDYIVINNMDKLLEIL